MDSIDLAQERDEQLRAAALANIPRLPGTTPALWYCEDCLVAIPEARRQAVPGCTRCVDCQSMAEGGGRG